MEYSAVYKFSAKISQRLIGLWLKMADRQGAGCSFLVAGYWLPTYALLRRAPTYVKTSVDRSVGKLVAGCRLLGAGYWLPTYAKKQLRWVNLLLGTGCCLLASLSAEV